MSVLRSVILIARVWRRVEARLNSGQDVMEIIDAAADAGDRDTLAVLSQEVPHYYPEEAEGYLALISQRDRELMPEWRREYADTGDVVENGAYYADMAVASVREEISGGDLCPSVPTADGSDVIDTNPYK